MQGKIYFHQKEKKFPLHETHPKYRADEEKAKAYCLLLDYLSLPLSNHEPIIVLNA